MIKANDESSSVLEQQDSGLGLDFSDDNGRQSLPIVGSIAELSREQDEVDRLYTQSELSADVVDGDVTGLAVEVFEVAHFSKRGNYVYIMGGGYGNFTQEMRP